MTTVRVEIIDPTVAHLGPSFKIEVVQLTLARAYALATKAVLSQTPLSFEGLLRAVRALDRAAASSSTPAPPFVPR